MGREVAASAGATPEIDVQLHRLREAGSDRPPAELEAF